MPNSTKVDTVWLLSHLVVQAPPSMSTSDTSWLRMHDFSIMNSKVLSKSLLLPHLVVQGVPPLHVHHGY
jgi:hypothetical protein